MATVDYDQYNSIGAVAITAPDYGPVFAEIHRQNELLSMLEEETAQVLRRLDRVCRPVNPIEPNGGMKDPAPSWMQGSELLAQVGGNNAKIELHRRRLQDLAKRLEI